MFTLLPVPLCAVLALFIYAAARPLLDDCLTGDGAPVGDWLTGSPDHQAIRRERNGTPLGMRGDQLDRHAGRVDPDKHFPPAVEALRCVYGGAPPLAVQHDARVTALPTQAA